MASSIAGALFSPSDILFGGNALDSVGASIVSGGMAVIILSIAVSAFGIAQIVPGIAVVVRRLHDTGRRWYWILINYIPLIYFLIVFLVMIYGGVDNIGSVFALIIIGLILSIACGIFMIVLMALPTSPNAIGVSTHDGTAGGGYYAGGGAYGGYAQGGAAPATGNIVGMSGMYANVPFPIEAYEELVIGRDSALSHIVVDTNAEKISRQHVSISYDPGQGVYVVTDLSSNGTYLNNGTRLSANIPMNLPIGSVIYLAKPDNSFRLA
jgi:uncharacterized membrane protein YhaH (DUF805 family)